MKSHGSSLPKDMPPSTNEEQPVPETKLSKRGPRSVKRGISGKSFASKKQLPLHRKVAPTKKRGINEASKRRIPDVGSLNEVSKSNEKAEKHCFRCSHCAGKFFNEISFSTHEKLCISRSQASINAESPSRLLGDTPEKNQSPQTMFKCSYCSYFCNDLSTFKVHEGIHARTESYSCDYCDKIFVRKTMLTIHLRSHGIRYSCKICGKLFETPRNVQNHANRVHGQSKLYSCEHCGKRFRNQIKFDIHLKLHSLKSSASKTCGKQFGTLCIVQSQKNEAETQIESYNCDHCDKKFVRKTMLDVHLRLHGLQFTCKTCGKRFDTPRGVQTHVNKAHGQTKLYSCEECDKKFIHQSKLNVHLKLHSLTNSCKICGKQFGTARGAQNHANKVHNNESNCKSSHLCALCGKTFSTSVKLLNHVKNKHSSV